MKVFKRVTFLIALIGIGSGGMVIYTKLMRQHYVPKELKLASSDISIDSIVQTLNSEESVSLNLIVRNTSSKHIFGEVVFEVELDPAFIDTKALEKFSDELIKNKSESINTLNEKLDNLQNYTPRKRQDLIFINDILNGKTSTSIPKSQYLMVENEDLTLDKYIFRHKHYLNLIPLEVLSFSLSSPRPEGFGYSKPTIRAISVTK